MPAASAPRARRRLISAARAVPPVIDEISSGARSAKPRNVVDTSTSASAISGSASWCSRTASQPASSRDATSSRRHTSRWRDLRCSVDSAMRREGLRARGSDHLPHDGRRSTGIRRHERYGRRRSPSARRWRGSPRRRTWTPARSPPRRASILSSSRASSPGEARVAVPVMARLARALRLRPIAFLQQTELLGLTTYAGGLDPLYFLPDGPTPS